MSRAWRNYFGWEDWAVSIGWWHKSAFGEGGRTWVLAEIIARSKVWDPPHPQSRWCRDVGLWASFHRERGAVFIFPSPTKSDLCTFLFYSSTSGNESMLRRLNARQFKRFVSFTERTNWEKSHALPYYSLLLVGACIFEGYTVLHTCRFLWSSAATPSKPGWPLPFQFPPTFCDDVPCSSCSGRDRSLRPGVHCSACWERRYPWGQKIPCNRDFQVVWAS